ncbi:MAG: ABC transporter ATP-binding protein [Eubacteriales bacterium]|nr:ABC transporter ATP-binding protein [Eubacteriales bacterium]
MSCTSKRHILEIDELSVSFLQYESGKSSRQIELPVISKLSVSVHEGEIVAVVGSSGSGKSLLAHAILGLLPYNAKVAGDMYFDGELLDEKKIAALRGNKIAFVPQSTTYLDPLMTVGAQVRGGKEEDKKKKQRGLFKRYGLKEEVDGKYPFECSGGMTRRVLLTTALMGDPELIIADEPTPGMDLALAKKSMEDFRTFADEGKGVLLITHDIELALEVADRIAVFYAGTTIEEALVSDFGSEETLRHPYTKALWRALPQNGFQPLPGIQPYVKDMPQGCPFGPRCSLYSEKCQKEIPIQRVGCGTVRCVQYAGEPLAVHSHHHHVREINDREILPKRRAAGGQL